MGIRSLSDISVDNDITLSGSYQIDGIDIINTSSTYTQIRNPEGDRCIFLGDSADPTTYFDNTGFYFRSAGGNSTYLVIGSGGATFTGVLALPDGSASAPSIGNTGDTNTGMYWPGDHQLGFAVEGSRKFYMSTTKAFFQNLSSGVEINAGGIDVTGDSTFAGDVGIGTDSPAQPLSVHGNFLVRTTNADGNKNRMQCIVGGSSDAANLYLYYGNSGDGTVSVRLNAQGDSYLNGGNVGIGTTSPNLSSSGTALTVNSSSGANAAVEISDGGTLAGLLWGRSGTGVNVWSIPSIPLIFGAANTERMRLNPSNQTMTLTANTATGTNYIQFNNNAATAQGYVGFGSSGNNDLYIVQQSSSSNIQFQNSGSTKMLIDTSGNVGIGVTNPSSYHANASNLVVADSSNGGISIVGSTTGRSSLHFADGTSGGDESRGFIVYRHTENDMLIGTDDATAITIDNDQRVGIGTTSPTAKLEIDNGSTAGGSLLTSSSSSYTAHFIANTGSGNAGIYCDASNGDFIGSDYVFFGQHDDKWAQISSGPNASGIRFMPADSIRMVINNSGQVGIGTTSPGSYNAHGRNLVVAGSGNVGITIDGANTSSGSICFADGTSSTASIAGKIEYDHSSDTMEFRTAATTRMALNSSSLTVSGDVVAFGSPSDKRYKENIKPVTNALDKVSKLQGVTFDWKESESLLDIKEDIGFIAQDVQEVLPELVRENEDGKLSLRDKGIVPILVEAIKELKAEIEELKNNK